LSLFPGINISQVSVARLKFSRIFDGHFYKFTDKSAAERIS